jgi:hypothetical protein
MSDMKPIDILSDDQSEHDFKAVWKALGSTIY